MRRVHQGTVRPDWQATIAAEGLVYSDTPLPGGDAVMSYWREGPYYALSTEDVDTLATAANTLWQMCIEAGDHIIEHRLFAKMGIPPWAVDAIVWSWRDDDPRVYHPQLIGRFDLRYCTEPALVAADPTLAIPKLFEFNADTPTSLVESTVTQWNWHLATGQGASQWNNAYEALVTAWKRNLDLWSARSGRTVRTVHFAYTSGEPSGEDEMNTTLLADTAAEAGYRVKLLHTEDIQLVESTDTTVFAYGIDGVRPGRFLDRDNEPIELIFKLYPWEWLFHDDFGKAVLWNMRQPDGTLWIEPPYKALWSNKAILAVLWELFGDDPDRGRYLLPTWFEGEQPPGFTDYARKPLLGREGANVSLHRGGTVLAAIDGDYGAEGHVLQQLAPLPDCAGPDGSHHPVCGVWMVDGEAAGLGIRESDGLITDNLSYFAPHVVNPVTKEPSDE